jgi:membrane peptidoglycan carboxypeptidase
MVHGVRAAVVVRWVGACVMAGVLVAGVLFPVVGGVGLLSNIVSDSVSSVSTTLAKGVLPQVSTITDARGTPIATFWSKGQRRTVVPSDQISQAMKLAVVSIEDKRFFSNNGVDIRGTLRAALTNAGAGQTQQGASTLTQQYVKNYELLTATTPADQAAATADTVARKIRDVRVALTLDQQLTKDEILTRYLNLVPFGTGAYGVEQAARTYFGEPASALTVAQSAMLAGMVQSSSVTPYTDAPRVLDRRNLVLSTMRDNGVISAADATAAQATPLGALPQPQVPGNGCIGAGDNGFFCDFVLKYLGENGVSADALAAGGLTIATTLDPVVQASTKAGVNKQAPADLDGIADVMSVVAPGTTAHKVLAMVSSRTYGLDGAAHQTVLGQPFTTEGAGAGSVFKVFTTAAAMEKGLGINDILPTPTTLQLKGFGDSAGANGCPAKTYCVKNYNGNYKQSYSVTQALAESPNTAFVKLISEVGVGPTVDMAVKLGLRSYLDPGSAHQPSDPALSLADQQKNQNLASFTLGDTPVNPLELSNVAATLASGGTWCPPTPIASVTDATGSPVALHEQPCAQVVDPALAGSLATGLSQDHITGTARAAAASTGWNLPLSSKTGTTDSEFSDAFFGFTNTVAGAAIIYDDSSTQQSMCTSPLRHCPTDTANLTGGAEPARSWFDALTPVIGTLGQVNPPTAVAPYLSGTSTFAQPPAPVYVPRDNTPRSYTPPTQNPAPAPAAAPAPAPAAAPAPAPAPAPAASPGPPPKKSGR